MGEAGALACANVRGVNAAVGAGGLPAASPLTAASTQLTHGWVAPFSAAVGMSAVTMKDPLAWPVSSVIRNGISGSPVPHPNGLTSAAVAHSDNQTLSSGCRPATVT